MRVDTLFNEGKDLFVTGHPEESIDLFTKAAEEGCNPVAVYLSRGAAYMGTGHYREAEGDFGLVLGIDTDHERAHYYRGIARLVQGNFEGAVKDLTASLVINHERGVSYLARGIALAELGREDEAVRDFKTATVFSNVEVGGFMNLYGTNRSHFDRSLSLLEGDRGPWKVVMNEQEITTLKKWLE